MLRNFQPSLNRPVDTMNKAEVDMKTGMGVVKDMSEKLIKLPAAEIGMGVFFLDQERIPIGINALRTDMSDYHSDFVDVKEGSFAKLEKGLPGDRFGTDQYVATGLSVGNYLSVGTDGKWMKATEDLNSVYLYGGTFSDNGNTLAIIEVTDEVGAN
jgi:hypothetical protein